MSTRVPLAPLQSLLGHRYTLGTTITDPDADATDFSPFLEATIVFVRMLLSSVAITNTFLFAALGVLMFPKSTFAPPPCLSHVIVVGSKLPAEQTTVGIKNAFENDPPPDPADWASACTAPSCRIPIMNTAIEVVTRRSFVPTRIPVPSPVDTARLSVI